MSQVKEIEKILIIISYIEVFHYSKDIANISLSIFEIL